MTRMDSHTEFVWNPTNVAVVFLAALCALLANAAGVGGGPLYMALFNGVLGFDMTLATVLSNTVIAASSLASSSYGLLKPSPVDPTRPLIDFNLLLTYVPPLLVGAGIGVLLNVLCPEWLQVAALITLLVFVIYRTYNKGKATWRAESARQEALARAAAADSTGGAGGATLAPSSQLSGDTLAHGLQRVRGSLISLAAMFALWLGFLGFQLALSHHQRCSLGYATLWAGQSLLCISFGGTMIWFQVRPRPGKDEEVPVDNEAAAVPLLRDSPASSDDRRSLQALLVVTGVMAVAGVAAGVLGIGGALIFQPYLLSLNVHPQVAASTSVMMILFNSSCVSLSFFFQGLLNQSYAAVFAPVCFAASLLGVTVVGNVVKQTGRASIIIFLLAGLLFVGTIVTAIFGASRAYEDILHGGGIGFKPFCKGQSSFSV